MRHRPLLADDIRRVAEFARPFDPLITYFLHGEVAELYARSQDGDVRAEWLHRLHTIYFADPRDTSVRNVSAVVALAAANPEVADNAADRFDHLNALLSVLKTRWDNRTGTTPDDAGVVLNDIERAVSATVSALDVMDGLAESNGIAADEWSARKRYLEKTLVRRLRTYRNQVLPHHRRSKTDPQSERKP